MSPTEKKALIHPLYLAGAVIIVLLLIIISFGVVSQQYLKTSVMDPGFAEDMFSGSDMGFEEDLVGSDMGSTLASDPSGVSGPPSGPPIVTSSPIPPGVNCCKPVKGEFQIGAGVRQSSPLLATAELALAKLQADLEAEFTAKCAAATYEAIEYAGKYLSCDPKGLCKKKVDPGTGLPNVTSSLARVVIDEASCQYKGSAMTGWGKWAYCNFAASCKAELACKDTYPPAVAPTHVDPQCSLSTSQSLHGRWNINGPAYPASSDAMIEPYYELSKSVIESEIMAEFERICTNNTPSLPCDANCIKRQVHDRSGTGLVDDKTILENIPYPVVYNWVPKKTTNPPGRPPGDYYLATAECVYVKCDYAQSCEMPPDETVGMPPDPDASGASGTSGAASSSDVGEDPEDSFADIMMEDTDTDAGSFY